jgi:hypothetical protein
MLAIMSSIFFSQAQAQNFSGENGGVCGVDSCKTAKLNISTGIGVGPGSDSVLMKGGYGYNTYYSTPNDNRDTIWTVAHLSSKYKPRIKASGFDYTGVYMMPGGHPSIIAADLLPGLEPYHLFAAGGRCTDTNAIRSSNWLSVYADAGGQNKGLENGIGDGYAYERCFFLCNSDSLIFDLKLMADDIVDTVQVDNINLYVTATPTADRGYICSKMISVNQRVFLSSGTHTLRVWTRDIKAGHLGLNVYGYINTAKGSKNLVRNKYYTKCETTIPTGIAEKIPDMKVFISPNPNRGEFHITIPPVGVFKVEIIDVAGRRIFEREVTKEGSFSINEGPGTYFVKVVGNENVNIQRVTVQ